MTNKSKFASKGRDILGKGTTEKVKSVGDFFGDTPQATGKPTPETARKPIEPDSKKAVRQNFMIPLDLGEELRQYAFEHKTSKTAVVVQALREFLKG